MDSLKNIRLRRLFVLEPHNFGRFNEVLRFLRPIPRLRGREPKHSELGKFEFGEVISIKDAIADPTTEGILEVFRLVFGLSERKIMSARVVEFYHALNWVKKELEKVQELEKKYLHSEPNGKLKNAGIDRLKVFGEMNTILAISKEFGKSPYEIEKWEYNLIFTISYQTKITSEINEKYLDSQKLRR